MYWKPESPDNSSTRSIADRALEVRLSGQALIVRSQRKLWTGLDRAWSSEDTEIGFSPWIFNPEEETWDETSQHALAFRHQRRAGEEALCLGCMRISSHLRATQRLYNDWRPKGLMSDGIVPK